MPTMRKTNKTSLVFLLAGLFLVFLASAMALVSYKVGYWPWELRWLDSGQISSPVWLIIVENSNEFGALAISTFLMAMFVLAGLCENRDNQSATPSQQEVDAQFDDDDLSIHEDVVSSADHDTAKFSESGAAAVNRNRENQLQIALAEVTRLKKELVNSRRETETADEVKAQFLANMSHELRTPMNGIMGMTDLLLESDLSDKQKHFAESVNASSESLLHVINDLLDYSRIESGDMQLDKARFDLGASVEEVCSMLASAAQRKDVELICYVDEDMPKFVDGDASRLRQVLNNLISNAIAFTDEGEVVVRVSKIESTDSCHTFKCDVQDTGAGIAPELQISLFESFKQADQSNTRSHGGLGIGLSITHQLIKLMDGDISFRSRLGEGTRFTFTAQFQRVADEDLGRSGGASFGGASVLIVDDNETNRSILFHQLSGWGLEPELAIDGPDALAKLSAAASSNRLYDAMITDLQMPGMDGIELMRKIRSTPAIAKTKAMMLTSAIVDISAEEMHELRIDAYISKPARQSQLRECLRDLIASDGIVSNAKPKFVRDLKSSDDGEPMSVLLVEDDPVNRDVVTTMLNGLNCTVAVVSDGQEAVSIVNKQSFDVIFMDCEMPVMDGFLAASHIKEGGSQNANTPIVALTANAMPGDRERCLEAGMEDYLSKPVRRIQLSKILEKWAGISTGVLETPSNVVEMKIKKPDIVLAESSTTTSDTSEDQQQDQESQSAEADGTASSAIVINEKALGKIRELQRPGKDDLLTKVVRLYFDKTPSQIDELNAAVAKEDYSAVKALVHGMKSSSAYLGAEQLAATCAEIETSIRNQSIESIATMVESLVEQYGMVEEELQQHIKAA